MDGKTRREGTRSGTTQFGIPIRTENSTENAPLSGLSNPLVRRIGSSSSFPVVTEEIVNVFESDLSSQELERKTDRTREIEIEKERHALKRNAESELICKFRVFLSGPTSRAETNHLSVKPLSPLHNSMTFGTVFPGLFPEWSSECFMRF